MALTVVADVFNVFSSRISQLFSDFWELEQNFQLLNNEIYRLEQRSHHIQRRYEDQQRQLPPEVAECMVTINKAVEEVDALIVRADRQRDRCFGCGVFCSLEIPTQIRKWRTTCTDLSQRLNSLDTDVGSATHQAGLLLQPLPNSGLVGSGIEASQQQLLTWLNESHPQARVIGVWGMGGVGKTALLRLIYNNCQKVSTSFDFIIWHTISQNYQIQSLQDAIAESLKLKFEPSYSTDKRRMKLYDSLKDKRFLLVLDDLWSTIDLNEVGVNFGHDKNSRVLISSRYRHVVEIMAEKEYCMMIRPLSEDEGWELFQKTAFKNGAAQDKNLEVIARQVASECKGLPLAINTVAAAIARNENAEEWRRDLDLMKNADPSFPSTRETIEVELYQKLRYSYERLPSHGLKMCFLYCAAFPEDADIEVERLVEMWTAERLFLQKGKTYFMDVGRKCIESLVDRSLIEYVDAEKRYIKIHDVLRDMAIYVGQGEENCLFQAGQHLQKFPSEEETRDCKRISVLGNDISDLPPDFKCPTLVSLVLAGNRKLKEIPEGFLVNCMSLKVLDLSYTSIKTLPTAVGQLGQLEFLNLKECRKLKGLPDSICDLSHLQFLNLEDCESLDFLPDKIGALKNLKHLTVSRPPMRRGGLRAIPHQIFQLSSLNKLVLPRESTPMCLEDLTNLSNLIELDVTVKPEIKGGSMSKWSKMRKLRLRFEWGEDEKRDDAALDILPQNMQSMEELQSLELEGYQGVSLPTCICQFQNLKNLQLLKCMNLESVVCNATTMSQLQTLKISYCSVLKTLRMEELPNLRELAVHGCAELKTLRMEELPKLRELAVLDCAELKELFMESGGCFPQLEELSLSSLRSLESIVCNAKTMPQLRSLLISLCGGLKTLRMEELPNLRKLCIGDCAELKTLRMEELPNLRKLYIKDCAELKELFMESGGCFPQLEKLILSSLRSLESIVCNAKTMPQLHSLLISFCGGLKTLRMEELPNLRKLDIEDCAELKELFMESGGCFPQLEKLILFSLRSLESIVCNAKTMPQLHSLWISDCGGLKTLRMEEFPDLQHIGIYKCPELEVEIESLPMLKELRLEGLEKAESIARPSSVWNSDTMPNLEVVQITVCPLLRRMPREMEKLPKLKKIVGNLDWWDGISWENNVKSELSNFFKEFEESDEDIWRWLRRT